VKQGTRGEARLHVNASPEELYEMVADVTRMGEWSPETVRCRWLGEATRPAVGVRFKGWNRRGIARWTTTPVVVSAEPGREFAFETADTRWTYRFEPASDGGTELTESFEMTKNEPLHVVLVGRYLLRIKDRQADLETAMTQTLGRIKAAAKGQA